MDCIASLSAFVETKSACTGGKYISSQSSQRIYQYTTLMSPTRAKQLLYLYHLLLVTAWGGDH